MRDYLTIDGSHGEGGGSIIRLSVALAALYSKPIKIVNIRKNRRNPGLRLQHCVGIKLIRDIMGGDLTGAEVGSSTVEYRPANNSQLTLGINHFKVKVTTAASIGLIFQALSLPLLSSKQKFTIEIEGGATYGQWAPSITYIQEVTLRYFRLFGIPNFTIEVLKHGFYPKGGAHVLLSFEPNEEKQGEVNLTKISTPLEKLKIFSLSAYSLKRYRDPRSVRPSDRAATNEMRERVAQAIGELDAHHRVVVVLRDIEGLNYEQIAEVQEVSVGTVKSRVFRARSALRDKLEGVLGGPGSNSDRTDETHGSKHAG